MKVYAGLDVSHKRTEICVLDGAGAVLWRLQRDDLDATGATLWMRERRRRRRAFSAGAGASG